MAITQSYLDSLPEIYRDILSVFPRVDPSREPGSGLAYQTLYAELESSASEGEVGSSYSQAEIIAACRKMEEGGAVEIKHRIFVHPTDVGEEIIAGLTGESAAEVEVPEFPNPLLGF